MVGYGTDSTFHDRAFLLSYTPDTVFHPQPIFIPPPASEPGIYGMLLVGLGLGLVEFMARRRKIAVV